MTDWELWAGLLFAIPLAYLSIRVALLKFFKNRWW